MNTIKKLLLIASLALTSTLGALAQVNITMWGVDHAHTFVNSQETILTPSNVSSSTFGQLFTQPLDGQVYGQILYAGGLTVGGNTHNVVFVGTQHCGVYAFDADNNAGPNASPLWYDSLIPTGAIAIPYNPTGTSSIPFNSLTQPDIDVEMGMTASMVIDISTKTIYAITKVQTTTQRTDRTGSYAPGTFQQYLHALDLTTGAEKTGSPVLINPSFAGTGNYQNGGIFEQSGTTSKTLTGVVPFNALHEHARAALTEYNNTIFITYASHTDSQPYHGEILGYNATTLQLTNWFIATPNGTLEEGGMWNGGASPAVDTATGSMYTMTGNGDWGSAASGAPYTTNTNFGESVVKLPTNATGQYSANLSDPTTFFTPNIWDTLNRQDADLGASGVCLVPAPAGTSTSLVVGGGKGSILYVLDRTVLGGEQATDAAYQEISEQGGRNLFATPAYFFPAGAPNGYIYYAPSGGSLEQRAVVYNSTTTPPSFIADPPTFQSTDTYPVKGSGCFITANGNTNGLVWMVNGSLRVHNAANVSGSPIYQFNIPNTTVKFAIPTVANGKAYITNYSESGRGANISCNLIVLGLLQQYTTIPSPAPTALTATTASSSSIKLAWSNTATNVAGFHVWRNTAATGTFTDITPGGISANITTFTDTGLSASTNYFYYVTSYNNVGDSAPTATVTAKTLTFFTAPGLVAYWPFDENFGGDGDPTSDATGHGHDGTLNGEFNWTVGQVSAALNFHGTNSAAHVDVANTADLQFSGTQSFTIGAWVFPTTVTSGKEQAIVAKSADQGNEYGLYINAAGHWAFRTGSSSNPTVGDVVGPAAVASAWTYISGVQDATNNIRTLYINGVAVATGPVAAGDGAGDLFIAAQNLATPNDNSYQGVIDEVRVYNIAIPASRMTDLMGPPILQAISNEHQGNAGTFGIQISPATSIVSEPREGSTVGSYNVVMTFSAPVSGIAASLQLQGGGTAVGTVGTITYDSTGSIVTVPLTGVANLQALNLHLTGIVPGNGTANIPFNIVWGDVNQSNYVDYLDSTVSTHMQGKGMSTTTYTCDVNCDGVINAADTTIVNSKVGTSVGTQTDANLALFQPASDSTSTGGNPALNAFDISTSGARWESQQKIDNQWLEVDLGSVSAIHSVTLYWEDAKAASYNLEYSTDNQTWFPLLATVTGNISGGSTSQTFSGLTASGRFVRMFELTRSTNFGTSVFEFQVNGIPGSHVANLAPSLTGDLTTTGAVGTALTTFTITASNSPTNFTATGLPPGLSISAAGAVTGTPTAGGTFSAKVTASNGSGSSVQTPVVFTITGGGGGNAPVVSATPAPPAGTVNTVYAGYQITASNTPTGYAVASGALPTGLTLNTTTGVISGTPTVAGTSTFGITASNGSGTSTAVTFSITINPAGGGGSAPVVSATPAPPAGTVNTAYAGYQITASNTPTGYAVASGALPTGLTLNTTTGVISGTPTVAATSTFGITASNGSGTSTAVTFSITINAGGGTTPVITTTTPPPGLQTGYYSYQLAASNNPTTYAVTTGTLPAGLTINANGVPGLIAGTPTGSGSTTVGITASNTVGAGTAANLTFTITANTDTNLSLGGIAVSSSPATDMGNATMAIDGNFGSRWETQHGLAADPSTITIDLQQSYAIDSIDIDWENASAQAYTIQVSPTGLAGSYVPLENITNNPAGGGMNLFTGLNTTARFVQLTGTSRTTPYGYSIWEFQIFGHATTGGSAPVVSATPAPPAGTVNTAYAGYQITASNTPTGYAVASGTLPTGLTLNTTTGVISGTPTVVGTSTFGITASNGSGTSTAVSFSITVSSASGSPSIVSLGTATGTTGTAFTYATSATNTPTGYALTTGTLPAGLTFNTTTGVITGTPTAAGSSTVTITASNGSGASTPLSLALTIYAAGTTPTITSATSTTATVGSVFSYQLAASDAPTGYALTSGTLPAGLTFSTTTGAITGTPTAAGTSSVTLTASNSHGASSPITLNITVNATSTDTNVGLNQLALASTVQGGNPIAAANDGNAGTRWAASSGTVPQYWEVNLGASKTLSRVDVNWFTNASRFTQYTVLTSTDGIHWTTQINKSANVTTGLTSDTFAAPVTAQYVLVNASFTSAGFVSINEIGVYGH